MLLAYLIRICESSQYFGRWKNTAKQLHQRPRSKSSRHDDWWTPEELFVYLCARYDLNPRLDVSATRKNKKCSNYITKRGNALEKQWIVPRKKYDVWCNPPNSLLGKFINKAWQQYKKHRMNIMMIAPANVISSEAFWNSVELPRRDGKPVFFEPIYKRQNFLEHGKKPKFSARNAYIVIIWGKKQPIYT